MRKFAVILAILLAATAARAELNLTTNDDWQSIIQSTNNVTINLAAGVYALTNTLIFHNADNINADNITIIGNPNTRDAWGVSSNSADEVILTGSGTSQVIWVSSGTVNLHISGLTIYAGFTDASLLGAGLGGQRNHTAKATKCHIVSNTTLRGAAVYDWDLIDSTISGNSATNCGPGGPYFCNLSNCVVRYNSAVGTGIDYGGAHTCTMFDSLIYGNTAEDDIAGVYLGYLERCTVVSNAAGDDFGGTYMTDTRDCIVEYNSADLCAGSGRGSHTGTVWRFNDARSKGGGTKDVAAWDCTVQSNRASTSYAGASGGTFYRTLFQGNYTTNSAATGGSAGGSDITTFKAYNCVFDGNYVTRSGKPQAFLMFGDIRNCTILNHTTNGPVASGLKSTSTVYNCIFWNNASNEITTATNLANNLIGVDPLFIAGPTNYLISSESPAIDAGDDTKAAPGADFYGRDRTTGLAVDIGAVEYQTADEPKAVGTRKKLLMMLLGGH